MRGLFFVGIRAALPECGHAACSFSHLCVYFECFAGQTTAVQVKEVPIVIVALDFVRNFSLFVPMRNKIILFIFVAILWSGKDLFAQSKESPNVLFVLADDWSRHAGAYGDKVVQTPNIDAIAREGAVFLNAFCAAPSCTPSRAAVLTGKYPHELEAGANLWGYLPKKFDNYSAILEEAGYHVGFTGKGWGPGKFEAGDYSTNPAGERYRDFKTFFQNKPADKPFSFWFGSINPHRPYQKGSGAASGMDPDKVKVPAWLPDVPAVRNDILDYYYEVQLFDQEVGSIVKILKESGSLDNTFIVITGDNGMPFPRAKANLYDPGTGVPLIISLKGKIEAGITIDGFVSLVDIAPTILEITRQTVPASMTGKTLWPLLREEKVTDRDVVFSERERHANVRRHEQGYPGRAVRTKDFLYIRNYEPTLWPAGDPEHYHSVGPYGDVDASPAKEYLLDEKENPAVTPHFLRAFEKRPPDELYDLKKDPDQLANVASDKKYRRDLERFKKQLKDWQAATGDPRISGSRQDIFDRYPYYGPPTKGSVSNYHPPIDK
jgi:N-sulfoglucosamine sulfohydrolase